MKVMCWLLIAVKAESGKIIVGSINGEMLVRRFQKTYHKAFLTAENKKLRPVEIDEFVRFDPWGVVTCVIHVIDPVLQSFLDNRKKDKSIG